MSGNWTGSSSASPATPATACSSPATGSPRKRQRSATTCPRCRFRGEPVAGELHAVAGVAGEADDDPVQLPDLLGHAGVPPVPQTPMVCRVLGALGGPRRWGSLACGSSLRYRDPVVGMPLYAARLRIAPYRPVP